MRDGSFVERGDACGMRLSGLPAGHAAAILRVTLTAAAIGLLTLLRIVLRVLAPAIWIPLTLGTLGSLMMAIIFGARHDWPDTGRVLLLALTLAIILGLFLRLLETMDPSPIPSTRLRLWR